MIGEELLLMLTVLTNHPPHVFIQSSMAAYWHQAMRCGPVPLVRSLCSGENTLTISQALCLQYLLPAEGSVDRIFIDNPLGVLGLPLISATDSQASTENFVFQHSGDKFGCGKARSFRDYEEGHTQGVYSADSQPTSHCVSLYNLSSVHVSV